MAAKARFLGRRNIDQEQGRGAARNIRLQLAEQARSDPGQHHQQRQPEPQSDRQPHGRRSGPVERRDSQAGQRPAAAPQPPCQPPQAEAEQGKGPREHRRPACPDGGELPVARAVDGERDGRERRQQRHDQVGAKTFPRRWRHRRAGPGQDAPRPRGRPGPSLPRSSPAGRTAPLRPTPAAGPSDRARAEGSSAATSAIRRRRRRLRAPARWQSPPTRSPRPRSTASPRPSAAGRRAVSIWR